MGDAPSKPQCPNEEDDQKGAHTHTHNPASVASLNREQCMAEAPHSSVDDTPSHPSESRAGLTQDQCRCGVCEQVLRERVEAACGHCVCEPCTGTHAQADPSGPSEDHNCPLCKDTVLQSVIQGYKARLRRRFECMIHCGTQTPLSSIYTALHVTESECGGSPREHEVWRAESSSRLRLDRGGSGPEPVSCNDIFKPPPGTEGYVKTALTKGVAGVGKTVSVHKFVLDWADGLANRDIDFVFVFPFRSLNVIKHSWCSLHGLLLKLHPELRELRDAQLYENCRVALLFDGLDESQLALNFQNSYVLCDTNNFASVDVLVTNLIQGNLLPSAQVWLTSRPAAANQIPAKYVDRVTEIHGFTDQQKEEYFRKRIGEDEDKVRETVSHIKSCRSLRIMCQIPALCSMAAMLFPRMLAQEGSSNKLPQTLTEMFIHFLLRQVHLEMEVFDGEDRAESDASWELKKEVVVKLSELAFTQLDKGNLTGFSKDALEECGIGVGNATVYSVIFREIFQEESQHQLEQTRVFSFTHPSVQEFLAAFFAIHCAMSRNVEPLEEFLREHTSRNQQSGKNRKGVLSSIKTIFEIQPLDAHRLPQPAEEGSGGAFPLGLLRGVVDRAVEDGDGQLDHFLRFLVGLSLEPNQSLLQGLLPEKSPDVSRVVAEYIRVLLDTDLAPGRCITLLRCLEEAKDEPIHRDLQKYLRCSRRPEEVHVSPALCSALAHWFLVSREVQEELDVRRCSASDRGHRRLVPALRSCRKAVLTGCELDNDAVDTLASVLPMLASPLRELDMSGCALQDSWVTTLSTQLKSATCRLEALRLSSCSLTDTGCVFLCSVLGCPSSRLRELDLSTNPLGDKAAMLISAQLESPACRLQTLRVSSCGFTDAGCKAVASAVRAPASSVRELDLRGNTPTHPTAQILLNALLDPHSTLHTLRLDDAAELWKRLGPVQYACALTLEPNTAHCRLSLSPDRTRVTHSPEEQPYPPHAERFEHRPQVLCSQPLARRRCYWEAEWGRDEGVSVGVAYRSIGRKGWSQERLLGYNERSWCLYYSHDRCSAWHAKNQTLVPHRLVPSTQRQPEPTPNKSQTLVLHRLVPSTERQPEPTPNKSQTLVPHRLVPSTQRQPEPDPSQNQTLVLHRLVPSTQRQPEPTPNKNQTLIPHRLVTSTQRQPEPASSQNQTLVAHRLVPSTQRQPELALSQNPNQGQNQNQKGAVRVSEARRVGVYLDWPAGCLSFYSVHCDALVRLHVFLSEFTEPLYAAFRLRDPESTLTLCLAETQTHTQSPQTHTQSPQTHTQSPQTHTQSPQTHTQSPQTHTQSPQTHTQSPQTHTQSPQLP
ncbi:hypothetical protein ACEWY4_017183 [Coilia grayii]|uniref:Uncharacterized protein n=1 Tax=Coilia grayii TaxID=363190 RepID=A0ABD1JH75_9TELE